MTPEQLLALLKEATDAQREEIMSLLGAKDIKDILNKIRQDEKDKHQSKISTLSSELTKVKQDLEKLSTSSDKKDDPNSPVLASLQNQNSELKTQLESLYNAFQTSTAENNVRLAMAEAKAAYGDKLIPEMIQGTTAAEIAASAAISNRKYLEQEQFFKNKFGITETPEGQSNTQTTQATQTNGTEDSGIPGFSKEQVDALKTALGLTTQTENTYGVVPPANNGQATSIVNSANPLYNVLRPSNQAASQGANGQQGQQSQAPAPSAPQGANAGTIDTNSLIAQLLSSQVVAAPAGPQQVTTQGGPGIEDTNYNFNDYEQNRDTIRENLQAKYGNNIFGG